MAINRILDSKVIEFSEAVGAIAAGGGTEVHAFQLSSANDGGVVDIIVAGKTACVTT